MMKTKLVITNGEAKVVRLSEDEIRQHGIDEIEHLDFLKAQKPKDEIQRLESLITHRRLRERDMNIEQYVDPDTGDDLPEIDGGMAYIKWVYKKIVEQQAVIRQSM